MIVPTQDSVVEIIGLPAIETFVVPAARQDLTGLSRRLEPIAAAAPGEVERPEQLRLDAAPPRSPMGKLEDWA